MPNPSAQMRQGVGGVASLWSQIVVQLLPGSIAVAPYFVSIRTRHIESCGSMLEPGVELLVFFLAALLAGLVLEELGSILEARVWDQLHARLDKDHWKRWYDYLALRFGDSPPVALGYLSDLVVRLRFTRCMTPGLLIAMIGAITLSDSFCMEAGTRNWLLAIGGALLVFLLWSSYDLSLTVARIREELLRRVE